MIGDHECVLWLTNKPKQKLKYNKIKFIESCAAILTSTPNWLD